MVRVLLRGAWKKVVYFQGKRCGGYSEWFLPRLAPGIGIVPFPRDVVGAIVGSQPRGDRRVATARLNVQRMVGDSSGRRAGGNLFRLPGRPPTGELFERLAGGDGVLIERIFSTGQSTPPGEWLEEERDEWVVVLQGEAELSLADGTSTVLGRGDHTLIPAGVRHRVERTSAEPPCIWLAVHAAGLTAESRAGPAPAPPDTSRKGGGDGAGDR